MNYEMLGKSEILLTVKVKFSLKKRVLDHSHSKVVHTRADGTFSSQAFKLCAIWKVQIGASALAVTLYTSPAQRVFLLGTSPLIFSF